LFFLEFQAVADAYGCTFKYCCIVAGPRKQHTILRKIMYYLKCKIGLTPFFFLDP